MSKLYRNYFSNLFLLFFPIFIYGQTQSSCLNDDLCTATDLGTLTVGNTIGDINTGLYNNICGTNVNEPDPASAGEWTNEAGVWFSFSTTAEIPGDVLLQLLSDPENTGDPIDLEVALYESSNNTCRGRMRLVLAETFSGTDLAELSLRCNLRSNRVYFILVDGVGTDPDLANGVFGIQLTGANYSEGADFRCSREELGLVPDGGRVEPLGLRSNFCASSSGDPRVPLFETQVTVWFSFLAPASGHVIVRAQPETTTEPLDVQLAVFESSNKRCSGSYSLLGASDTPGLGEIVEVSCLNPGEEYFVMIDGFGRGGVGVFSMSVEDAGIIPPTVFFQDITLCAGDSLLVGNSTYKTSGSYVDTIPLLRSCDSIVFSQLTVLSPLSLMLDIDQIATAENRPDGKAIATANGGTGIFNYNWCSGENTASASQIVGGSDCQLDISDTNGCTIDTTFYMPFVTQIIPFIQSLDVDCKGNDNGLIGMVLTNGIPPYTLEWTKDGGVVSTEEIQDTFILNNLSPGVFEFRVTDGFGDTTFQVQINEPDSLVINRLGRTAISCTGACDGSVSVEAIGGNGNYIFQWLDIELQAVDPNALCEGIYGVYVTDLRACEAIDTFHFTDPEPLAIAIQEVNPVSCFQGDDGAVVLNSNYSLLDTLSLSGNAFLPANELTAGTYDLIGVTPNGCRDTVNFTIVDPPAPLIIDSVVQLELATALNRPDAAATVFVSGGWGSYQYEWCNGASTVLANNLTGGQACEVIVSDSLGCSLSQLIPEVNYITTILSSISTDSVNCAGGTDGAISMEIFNGKAPYTVTWLSLEDGSTGVESVDTEGGEFNLANLSFGQYQIDITDGFGDTTIIIEIFEPEPFFITATQESAVVCFGDQNGIASLSGNFPIAEAMWSSGDRGTFVSTLGEGVYEVSAISSAGCLDTTIVAIEGPPESIISEGIQQLALATAEGRPDGQATIEVLGGWGGYEYEWCSGETTSLAEALVGGESCSLTVTDAAGCQLEVTIDEVNYVTTILSEITIDSISCSGGNDGMLEVKFFNGKAPYEVFWQNIEGTQLGNTFIIQERGSFSLNNLSLDTYLINVTDGFGDTSFVIKIPEPSMLELNANNTLPSCFDFCDGAVQLSATGGNGDYQYNWPDLSLATNTVDELCAGSYRVEVIDRKGCRLNQQIELENPEPFLANIQLEKEVSCFGGDDGVLSVETNGNPIQYAWASGQEEARINGLSAGFYQVIVLNEDNCSDTTSIELIQPASPFSVNIQELSAPSCDDSADGILLANVNRPEELNAIFWNNGNIQLTNENLPKGTYSVTAVNSNNCIANDTIVLDAPPPLFFNFDVNDLTCLERPEDGMVMINEVSGGTPEYLFSVDDLPFGFSKNIGNLTEGEHLVTIEDVMGCRLSLPFEVLGPPEFKVNLEGTSNIKLGQPVSINARANLDIFEVEWFKDGVLLTEQEKTLVDTPLFSSVYEIRAIDQTFFCSDEAFIQITVNKNRDVFVANVFSPNGDGANDLLFIQTGNNVEMVKSFRIFSRYGSLVYQGSNMVPNDNTRGWDGTQNGSNLPPGVYVYFAELEYIDGAVEIVEGSVLLVR